MTNHKYQVIIRVNGGNKVFNVESEKDIDQYQVALLSGLNSIVDSRLPIEERQIAVTEQNLVSLTELINGVAQDPTERGTNEQETGRIREILGDEV